MIQSRRSRRNPMIRRVQRHALISALFGSSAPAFERTPSRQTPRDTAGEGVAPLQEPPDTPLRRFAPVVNAWLAPTPPPGEGGEYLGGSLGEGETPPSLPAFPPPVRSRLPEDSPVEPLRPRSPLVLQPAQKKPIVEVQRPRPSGEGLNPPRETSAEQSSKIQEPAETKAEAESTPPVEDRVWKRLQTIFQKHEEKRREEGALPPSPAAQSGTQPSPVQTPSEAAGDENTRVGAIQPVLEKPPDSQPETVMSASAVHPAAEMGPPLESEPSGQVVSSPGPLAGVQRQVADQPARPAPGKSESLANTLAGAGLPAQEPSTSMSIASPEAGEAENAASEAAVQEPRAMMPSLPEVGKTHYAAGAVASDQAVVQKPLAIVPPEAEEVPAAAAENVTQKFIAKDIAKDESIATQPVEQKPLVMKASPSEASRVTGQGDQALQPLPLEQVWPVQRQTPERARLEPQPVLPEEALPEVLGLEEHAQVQEALREVSPGQPTDSSVETITPRRPRPAPALQKKKAPDAPPQEPLAHPSPETGQRTAEALSSLSGTVETEIGPLPSDLWELIGESPRTALPSESEAFSTPGKPGLVQRRAEREPVVFRQAEQIQAPEPAAGEGPVSPGEQGAETAQAAAGRPSAEKDMDELAARVYAEVKKRLAVEWERLRRRF